MVNRRSRNAFAGLFAAILVGVVASVASPRAQVTENGSPPEADSGPQVYCSEFLMFTRCPDSAVVPKEEITFCNNHGGIEYSCPDEPDTESDDGNAGAGNPDSSGDEHSPADGTPSIEMHPATDDHGTSDEHEEGGEEDETTHDDILAGLPEEMSVENCVIHDRTDDELHASCEWEGARWTMDAASLQGQPTLRVEGAYHGQPVRIEGIAGSPNSPGSPQSFYYNGSIGDEEFSGNGEWTEGALWIQTTDGRMLRIGFHLSGQGDNQDPNDGQDGNGDEPQEPAVSQDPGAAYACAQQNLQLPEGAGFPPTEEIEVFFEPQDNRYEMIIPTGEERHGCVVHLNDDRSCANVQCQ